jgi:hypothetical protein
MTSLLCLVCSLVGRSWYPDVTTGLSSMLIYTLSTDSRFSADHPNVVHMTVKPQEVVDEEDAKGAKAHLNRDREASERSPGCRCVIL